jgi:hypothetical protein
MKHKQIKSQLINPHLSTTAKIIPRLNIAPR